LPNTKQETLISDLHKAWELHCHTDMVNLKSGKGKNKAWKTLSELPSPICVPWQWLRGVGVYSPSFQMFRFLSSV